MDVKFNWKPSKYWLPARWWSPGCLHLRIGPAVITLPRWLWRHKSDRRAKCNCCGRVKTIEGYPQFVWCRDCILLARQLHGLLGGPAWWLDKLRTFLEDEVWSPAPSGPHPQSVECPALLEYLARCAEAIDTAGTGVN